MNRLRLLQEQMLRYKREVFQKPRRGTIAEKVYNEERNFNVIARQRVEAMRKNIATNTPKIVAGLLIGSSLPQLYFYYQSMWLDYTDTQYYANIRKSVDYFNMKNAFFCATIFGLQVVKYCDVKATSRALPKRGNVFLWLLLPLGLSMVSLSFMPYLDKKSLFGSYFTDASLLLIETKLVSEAVMPFWFFNFKYSIHVFDLVYLTCIYFSMKRLRNNIDTMPHKYLNTITPSSSSSDLSVSEIHSHLKQLPEGVTSQLQATTVTTDNVATATAQPKNQQSLPSILQLQQQLSNKK